ncbi:MAG: hypothetical protein ACPGU9_04680 [Flavobacteriaceae bacterium]
MKYVIKFFDFCLNSSIWVAVAVCALLEVTNSALGQNATGSLLRFVFCGTVAGYNFIKFFEQERFPLLLLSQPHLWINGFVTKSLYVKLVMLLSLCCSLGCLYYSFYLKLNTLLVIGVSALLVLFYAISFRGRTLRSTSGIKIYVVGIVWALVTVILPYTEAKLGVNLEVLIIFIQRFLFVVILMLPFEIRDLKVDDENLGTLPQKIGIGYTKLLGGVLLVIVYVLEFFKEGGGDVSMIVTALILLLTFVFVLRATVKQSKYYSSFFVEGIPVLWWLILLML